MIQLKLKVSINLGNYEHISLISNKYDTIEKCVKELINKLSRIKNYEIDNYITEYLIPMLYDNPNEPEEYKTKKEALRKLDEIIKEKEAYKNELYESLEALEEDIRIHRESLQEIESKIKEAFQ